jgi:hypothetical protein
VAVLSGLFVASQGHYLLSVGTLIIAILLAFQAWGLRTRKRFGLIVFYVFCILTLAQLVFSYLPLGDWNEAYRAARGAAWFNCLLYVGSFHYFLKRRYEFGLSRRSLAPNKQELRHLLNEVGITMILLVTALATYASYTTRLVSEGPAYAVGYVLGVFLWPCLFVFLYYRITKRKPTVRGVAYGVSLLALLFSWVSLSNASRTLGSATTTQPKETVARLVREAIGAVPIVQGHSDDVLHNIVREWFTQLIALNRKYAEESARFDTPEMEMLYEPASFARRRTIVEIQRQLRQMLALDELYEGSYQEVFQDIRTQVLSSNMSSGTKAMFLEAFDKSSAKVLSMRRDTLIKEKKYLEAAIDIYELALRNLDVFSVQDDTLYIGNDTILLLYNTQLSEALQLEKEFADALQQYEQRQRAMLAEHGLSLADFGLSEP